MDTNGSLGRAALARFAALLIAVAAAAMPAAAQNGEKPLDQGQYITLQFDNDMFGGTDRHFTNGMRAAWLSPEGSDPVPRCASQHGFSSSFWP